MKKLLSFVLTATLMLGLPSLSFGDAPLPGGHYTLTGVKVADSQIYKKTKEGYVWVVNYVTSELQRDMLFEVRTTSFIVKGTEAKPFKILNPTVRAKSSVTVNKPITFRGENVPAGTNLSIYNNSKYPTPDRTDLNAVVPDLFPSNIVINNVVISKDFNFPAGDYVLTFKWITEQGGNFSAEAKVHIDDDLAGKK